MLSTLIGLRAVRSYHLWRISDSVRRFSELLEECLREREAQFATLGGRLEDLKQHSLLEMADDIRLGLGDFLAQEPEAVILDISSFPKRFFFPLTRWLLDSRVSNLAVTYTAASTYADGPLSENVEAVQPLPAFMGRPNTSEEALVIALGFQPLGIADMLGSGAGAIPVHVFFPYPGNPMHLRRVWAFVDSVKQAAPSALRPPIFISPIDVSDIVDHLTHKLGNGGNRYITLAPYGPKPLSLGMAIAAGLNEWPVLYTQPKTYHPHYTTHVQEIRGMPATFVYPLRIHGRNIYQKPDGD